ncbi:MAG TPA: hypothetical protein VLA12_24070 [Planctomycetaceae bacterium]|nr:hypothetical protein [Planctomycetaceae bacterium]
MSDEQYLNDPELQQLARILGGLPLRPSERERSRILLACGRAEGWAEAQRMIRKLRAGMLVFAGVSACLLGLLLNRPFATAPEDSPKSSAMVKTERPETGLDSTPQAVPEIVSQRIESPSVWTPRSNWDLDSKPTVQRPVPDVEEPIRQRPILTARSRVILDELLN